MLLFVILFILTSCMGEGLQRTGTGRFISLESGPTELDISGGQQEKIKGFFDQSMRNDPSLCIPRTFCEIFANKNSDEGNPLESMARDFFSLAFGDDEFEKCLVPKTAADLILFGAVLGQQYDNTHACKEVFPHCQLSSREIHEGFMRIMQDFIGKSSGRNSG